MREIGLLLSAAGLLVAGCQASKISPTSPEPGHFISNEPVDASTLDGLWEVSFSALVAAPDSNDPRPCNKPSADKVFLKVENSAVSTWYYGGRSSTTSIDGNGVFAFSKPSGYAYAYPGTKDPMPKPIVVAIRARITERGSGVGSIVYDDLNGRYARCQGALVLSRHETTSDGRRDTSNPDSG